MSRSDHTITISEDIQLNEQGPTTMGEALKPLLPLQLSNLNKLLLHPIVAEKNITLIKEYCQKQISGCYGAHASSTHPVLYSEFRLCFVNVRCRPSILEYLEGVVNNFEDFKTLIDHLHKQIPAIIDEAKQTKTGRSPIESYVLSWAKLPHEPLIKKLTRWKQLVELREHASSLQQYYQQLLDKKNKRMWPPALFRKPIQATNENLEVFLTLTERSPLLSVQSL